MKFLSDILAKAGLTVDGVVTLNNTATGQTPNANDNSTKLATTAWVRTFVQPYSLPIASASVLGGIRVGSGLSINSGTGVLSVTGASAASIKSTQTFVVTQGQTVYTVTNGYTPGLIDVFLNGVYLSPNQIVATNGTTFTINDPAATGDIVDIIVVSPIFEGSASTTDQLPEGVVNLYYTDARARAAISLTTTGVSGVATYNSSTGVFNIPNYQGLVPAGGVAGQVLSKVDGTDYNTQWLDEAPAASYTSQLKHRVKSSQAINKGQAVYVSSADGTIIIVSKASNASEGTSSKTMGLLGSTVSVNGTANVITEGLLAGLDTTGATAAGDPVWLGTDGNLIYGLANKPVAPAHLVFIGVVTRRHANVGEIFVKVQNGFEMKELHDYVESGVQDNYVISYESSTSLYKPKSIATLLGYTPANAARSLTINGTSYDLTADRTWTLTSSNIAEGTNLYYTDTRVGTYLTANSYNSGTGTSGQVAYFNGTTSITSTSSFAFNSSESNLTIDRSLSTVGNAITISKGSDVDQAWLAFRQGGGASGTWRLGYNGSPYDFRISVGSDASIGTQALRIFVGTQNVVIGTSTSDNLARFQVGGTATFSGNVGMGNTGSSDLGGRLNVRNEDAANNPTLVLFKNISSASTEDMFRVQSWNGAFNTVASIKANGSAAFSSSVTATGGIEIPNGQFYRARRSSSNLLIDLLGIESGTDNTRLLITGDFNIKNGSLATLLNITTTGIATFNSSVAVASETTDSSMIQQWGYSGNTSNYRLRLNTIVSSGLVKYSFDTLNASTAYNNNLVLDRGNVGIGTASPDAGLTIETNSYSYNALALRDSRAYNTSPEAALAFRTKYNSSGQYATPALLVAFKDNTTDGNQAGSLAFFTNANAGPVERMRLTSGGYLKLPQSRILGDSDICYIDLYNPNTGNLSIINTSASALYGNIILSTNSTPRITITTGGNVLIGPATDIGTRLTVDGTTYSTNYISGTQGLNVSGYGFWTQTISGQMTVLGHNISASSSVANQVNVVNSGWYSSMIRMYYSEGITFHTSSTVYSAGAVYPMGDTERVRIQLDGQVRFQNSIILTNGQINSLTSGGSGQSMYLNFAGNGAVYAGSSYAVLYAGSDERIKTEINHSQSTLTKILNLIPRTFKYKERPEVTNYGFIAQEVEVVMPELVRTSEGVTMCLDEEIENQKSVESYGLAWASILVKAIQEQQLIIESLKSRIETLEQA